MKTPRFKPRQVGEPPSEWRDMRDANGKLCARINTKRMVIEIKRSDRDIVAYFDLREYIVLEIKTDIE